MLKIITHLESCAEYSASRYHDTPKIPKETAEAYDIRTWREHAHADEKGNCFIPPQAFKMALDQAAQRLGERVGNGKGAATFTKHFLSGVQCMTKVPLKVKKDALDMEPVLCNAKGIRNGPGARVIRRFPVVRSWAGEAEWWILDAVVTEEVFLRHLNEAGKLVGVGRWRVGNGGLNGRFKVTKHKTIEE